ncbi:transmembrane protein 145-like [Ostrinia furnacalis]|uniref:transmembrane protein 145-like n=1 Tax=Ostrinia furnacalis TaxID=93504 RepID=UPI00103C93EF|nr:transmembrane protein 145-like [Ostrinia furnacalis]
MRSRFVQLWLLGALLGGAHGKWVEGRIDTKDNWAFLARFCFLSLEGQFEYLIEYDKDMGIPNLLLYYDDDNQWPAVYHSSKTCKEREAVLNKAGQNQIIKLSHWYPETEYSGCILTKANKELPASKSTTTTKKPTTKSTKITTKPQLPLDTTYYDQFLKTTTLKPKSTTAGTNSTTWYELLPTDDLNFTTIMPEDDLWESIGPHRNESQSQFQNLKDVEILFSNPVNGSHKIKRSTNKIYERYLRRRLHSESNQQPHRQSKRHAATERLVVSCHNSRRFRSARERWWFIAISNCDSSKGLDVRYKFLMTNGPDGDFWHEHFSADEFYVLPVLLAYTFAYVIVMIAVVMCSVELKCRHLLHSTYKLFLASIASQHLGVLLQTLANIRYASNGVGSYSVKTVGLFFTGISETTFLLLLILMAKGYTITRGRLKVAFTVKLTVFMCSYIVTYIVLFIYQAKAFDPGEVLYLYESPAGYGLIVLRILAWCVFAYSTFFTVRKYPEKNTFYCPFFICGTLWFYAGPLFILTANSYIDKWVRESVVIAVLLFITFSGHIMFLLLTLPVFANKNFPYHVRTTQIGVMEVTGSSALDSFGHNAYHPTSNGAAQTVIIPLTRRTEELIGNMYSQYMATAPPLSLENGTPKLNGVPHNIDSISPKNGLIKQDSTETNASDDIKPILNVKDKEIFTVEGHISKIEAVLPQEIKDKTVLPHENINKNGEVGRDFSRGDLPLVLRSRRNILEPIKREEVPVPSWSLAKGPCVVGMQKKAKSVEEDPDSPKTSISLTNGKKVPPVRNGLQSSSGEISTIHEGHVQTYPNTVSKATIDLFNASSSKG